MTFPIWHGFNFNPHSQHQYQHLLPPKRTAGNNRLEVNCFSSNIYDLRVLFINNVQVFLVQQLSACMLYFSVVQSNVYQVRCVLSTVMFCSTGYTIDLSRMRPLYLELLGLGGFGKVHIGLAYKYCISSILLHSTAGLGLNQFQTLFQQIWPICGDFSRYLMYISCSRFKNVAIFASLWR